MGNIIGMEAGSDIIVTGQAIENKLSEEELGKEKIIYTDINTKEVVEGSIEEAKSKGRLEVSGYREESVGSKIVASESLILEGNNIGVYGSTIYSEGLLALEARDTLEIGVIENLTNIDYSLEQRKTEKGGKWYKKKKTITTIRDEGSVGYTNNVGSNIIGGSIYLGSGEGIEIIASSIGNVEKEEEESSTKDSSLDVGETSSENPAKAEDISSEASPTSNSKDSITSSSAENPTPISNTSPSWEGISSGDIIINSGGDLSIRGAEDKRNYELSTDIKIKEISTGFSTIADNAKNLGKAARAYGNSWGTIAKGEGNNGQNILNGINSTANFLGAVGSMGDLFTIKSSASITNTHIDYSQQESTYVGSTLLGENVKISSGGDTQIKGSNVSASKDVDIKSEGVTSIEAGENTFASQKDYDRKSHSLDLSVGVGLSSIAVVGNVNLTYSYNNTKGNDYSTANTYTGSIISSGNNVNLSANKDINLIGSNVYGKNVSTSAENLNIQSLQNEYHSWGDSTSWGFSIGVGTNGSASSSGISGGNNGSLGFNYGEGKYDSYNLVTENVAGISASNDININASNNVSLKGAVLEGGNTVNLKANNLNIEDLKDISTSTSSNWGIGYTYSFGLTKDKNKENNQPAGNGVIGSLNGIAKTINDLNIAPLNFNLNGSYGKLETITAIKGGINKVGNIDVNTINIKSITDGTTLKDTTYDYSSNIEDIYTDTQNNKQVVYDYSKSYSGSISPGQWLSSTSGALSTISTYTEISIEAGKQVSMVYDAMKDESQASFYSTYRTLNTMDKLESITRKKGINILENTEEYMSLAKELGLTTEQVDVVVYGDETSSKDGYSHKNEAEIGLNLNNVKESGKEVIKDAEEIRGTTGHEIAHQSDKVNQRQEDREYFAETVGNNVEGLVGVNNWLYGDGGLNNTTISNYYNKNQTTLQLNNEYVSNLNPNLIENKAYMVSRNLGKPTGKMMGILEYEKLTVAHQFIVITGSEGYLNNYIKEYNIENNLNLPLEAIEINESMIKNGIEKTNTDTHYVTLGGYRGGSHTNAKTDGSEKGLLIKDFNSYDDVQFLNAGKFESVEIQFNSGKQKEHEKNIVNNYVGYNNEANYFPVPNINLDSDLKYLPGVHIINKYEIRLFDYNSNSFAYSICSNGGGTNCGYNYFSRTAPGIGVLIPQSYFKKNN